MNFEFIKKRPQYLSKFLWLMTLFLACAMVTRVFAFGVTSLRSNSKLKAGLAAQKQDDETVKSCLAKKSEAAGKLKEKNMFVAPSKEKPKPPVCLGLFGNSAIFKDKGDKLYKIGDKIKCKAGENSTEAEIVAIGPNEVTIMWEDKEMKLKPFDVSNETKSKDKGKKPEKPTPTPVGGGAQVVQQDQGQSRPRGGPRDGRRGGGGFGFSGDQMRQMRDRYMNMSPEERDRFRNENRNRSMNRGGRGRSGRTSRSRRR
jgi:hypothetical protein